MNSTYPPACLARAAVYGLKRMHVFELYSCMACITAVR